MCRDWEEDLDDYETAMSLADGGPIGLDLETPELAGLEEEDEIAQVKADLEYAPDGFHDDHLGQVVSLEGAHWESMEEHMLFYGPAQKQFHQNQHRERYYTPEGLVNLWERTQARLRKSAELERDPDHHRQRSRDANRKHRAEHPDANKAAVKRYRATEKGREANRQAQKRYRERQKLLKQQQKQFEELKNEAK